MKTTLSIVGLAATLLFTAALPACAAGPGDNSPSTGPSVELQRPQTAPAGATTTFYYWDHLGTVRMTAGEYPTAENVERHDYEPYGLEMLPATNQASNTHQFTGHERDTLGGAPSAALDYMHARFYGSNMGRFLSPDPGMDVDRANPQSWNRYAYVRNNPINAVDQDGENIVWAKDLSKHDKERLTKALAKAYRDAGFKSKFDKLEKSARKFTIGTGKLLNEHLSDPAKVAKQGGYGEIRSGHTEPAVDPSGTKFTGADMTLDFTNIDMSQRTNEPVTDVETAAHETFHAELMDEGKQEPENIEEPKAKEYGKKVDSNSATSSRAKKEERAVIDQMLKD